MLGRALPERLDGHERRDVSPEAAATAAWGKPPIVLRCGVEEPPVDLSGSPAVGVDGVTWQARQLPDSYLFTTVRRVAFVEVRVPRKYAPEVNPLIDLAPVVKATVACAPGTSGPDCDEPRPGG